MTKYFRRVIQVSTSGVFATNEALHIEFEIPFDDDHIPDTADIRVYNLSSSTIARFVKGAPITVTAGYEGDTGIIFEGVVASVWAERHGTDRATRIRATSSQGTENKKTVEKSYKKAVKSSTIIRDVAGAIGLPIKVLDLPNDKTHEKGYTADGKGIDIIKRVAEDCGASFYPILGQWYIRDIKKGDNIGFALSPETGLLDVPERITKRYQNKETDGWQVKALLQHRVKTAAILSLQSRTASGTFRVIGGKHIATRNDLQTHMEVV